MVAKAPSASADIEALRPAVEHITLPNLGDQVVRPLGFYSKTQLFTLLAGAVQDLFDSGEDFNKILADLEVDAGTIKHLQDPDPKKNSGQAESIVRLIVKFALQTPHLLDDLFLIAFQVKPEQRDAYINDLHDPGFTDAIAFKTLNVFIDLNASAIVDFFGEWKMLLTKASKLRGK